MDLTETMKGLLSKTSPSDFTAHGGNYVTEKIYMLLQLYLQNKGWNPSQELLQCFSDLKDQAMLPSAAYLQYVSIHCTVLEDVEFDFRMMSQRVNLDAQGRLVLRDTGKIILPFEHFANAVMLKHMNGPQGMHLAVDQTIRAVSGSSVCW